MLDVLPIVHGPRGSSVVLVRVQEARELNFEIFKIQATCSLLTLTLRAFLKSITSRPVGWIAHKSVGRSAHGRERWVLHREIRVGVRGRARGGGKVATVTAPSH